MHLDEEQLQRLLHRELPPAAQASVRAHLASCGDCRLRVDAAEREEVRLFELLGRVDHSPRRVSVEAIVARAGGRARGRALGHTLGWGRWAAGILLALVAAGAAYAAPGSPIPALVEQLVQWIERAPGPAAPVAPAAPAAPAERADSPIRGIAVAPGARFTIVFPAEQVNGVATVSFIDGEDVVVRALHGAATFSAGLDRLSVGSAAPSTRFEILIPRRARSVEISVAGRQVFLKEVSRVLTDAHRDAAGRYLLRLGPPAR